MSEKERLDPGQSDPSLTRDQLLRMYETMLLIRRFDEKVIDLAYHKGIVPGNLHSCIGQEAIAVGACSALRAQDCIISTHRGQGHCIAKGADIAKVLAEFLGKATGYCKGKGGIMHVADPSKGILGTTGIVGSGIPIAVGAGLAMQYKDTGQVILCFFGDGAANTGAFHEGLNLAAVWDLPVVFLCENNRYAETTPVSRTMKISDISDRAMAYGLSGATVDGNDVVAVHREARTAVHRARVGEGPSLIEAKTYRVRGHYEGEPANYRSDAEIEEWKARDPIDRLRARLVEEQGCSDDTFEAIELRIRHQIEQAVDFALDSPLPAPSSLGEGIYWPSEVQL